jgi:GNAT superfamily N-acetyltransferase
MERRSGYADRLIAKAAPSTLAERAELLEFRTRMYGPASVYADPAWVSWLYDAPPTTVSRGPVLWTWRHDDHIEAQQGAIRTRVRVAGAEYDLAWAIDLLVSPAHRQRGVGAVLPSLVVRSSEVTCGTEVSEAAQKSFRRAGWSDLGRLTQWVRVVGPTAFFKSKMAPLPATVLGGLAGSIVRGMDLLDRVRTRARRLVPVDHFDDRADAIWERTAPCWPVIARRDRAWLAWRWEACPRREGARLYWLECNSTVVGWVVLRHALHLGVPSAFIVDLLCQPEDLGALLALSVRELSRRKIAAVYCLGSMPGAARTFRDYGFIPRDSGFQAMNFAPALPDDAQRALGDPSQWFLTAGDSDLDRPRDSTVYA